MELGKYKEHKKVAYAKGYLTGKDHYRQIPNSHVGSVKRKAVRGYKRGFKDAGFEDKQRRIVAQERNKANHKNNY